jgi:hypothetical protein
LFSDTDFISPASGNNNITISADDDVTFNFTNCGFNGMYLSSEYSLNHPFICYIYRCGLSELYYSNCTFSNMTRTVNSNYGGVIGLSASENPSYALFVNCNFKNLELGSNTTGAVYFASSSFDYINVSHCIFSNIHAGYGGGLYFHSHSTADPQKVINCSFTNCTVNSYGGAIYLDSQPINITNCSFWKNNANGGFGNDIYLNTNMDFPSSNLEGSCSWSSVPTLSIISSDQSSLFDERCSSISECSIKDSNDNCQIGCKHSGEERTSSCEVDSCGIHSNDDDECLKINGCSLIDGRCSNISECSIKDSNDNCKIGCKHSGEGETSSCETDLCVVLTLSVCSSFSGCFISGDFCVSVLDECSEIQSGVECLSLPECDFFISGFCKKKSLYSGVCSLVGQGVCSNISECEWDLDNGCVKIKEEAKASESSSVLIFIIISLFKKSFISFYLFFF